MRVALCTVVAAIAIATGACSSEDPTTAEDLPAIEQMQISFNGSPSSREIQEALDNALNATDTPITEENYSRAGSVLVTFRQKYGVDEMDILRCIPSHVNDPRLPSPTFPNVAAICNVELSGG